MRSGRSVAEPAPSLEQLLWTWAVFNGSGTPALLNSRNISSITDVGTGQWTLVFALAYAAATYAAHAHALATGTTAASCASTCFFATAGIQTTDVTIEVSNTSATEIDSTKVCVLIVGAP